MTGVRAPDRTSTIKTANGLPVLEVSPRASQDKVITRALKPSAGWTELKVPKGATLTSIALSHQSLAEEIRRANLGRSEWTVQVKNRPDGVVGWVMGLFGRKKTRPEPRFNIGDALPEGASLWVPRELDGAAPAPKGFTRVALPAGKYSVEGLTGSDAAWANAFRKANPDLATDRLARGALYVNLPADLPLEGGKPAPPDAANRAAPDQLAKLARHLAHKANPHEVDGAHGVLKVRPGDTLAELAKLVFNDATRWQELKPARAGDIAPGDDLAGRGLTYVQLPKAYAAPQWGDVQPLNPKSAFLRQLAPAAARSEEQHGIPAAVILAQAAVESGDGTSTIGDFNCFGIKGVGSRGSISCATTEYSGGRAFRTQAAFADFGSWDEAIDAHADLFNQPVYSEAMQHKHDPIAFAQALNGRYATDPNYAATLIQTMREQGLAGN